ncbi:MAG: hypothetical protein R3B47_01885 [Bacteroidia bacterium]
MPLPAVVYDRSRVGITKRDDIRLALAPQSQLLNEYSLPAGFVQNRPMHFWATMLPSL